MSLGERGGRGGVARRVGEAGRREGDKLGGRKRNERVFRPGV